MRDKFLPGISSYSGRQKKNIKIDLDGIVHIGNLIPGYAAEWQAGLVNYVQEKKRPKTGKAYGARYVGSMVADVHRTIKYGGIFMYPATKSAPNGKVSLSKLTHTRG